MKLLNSGMYSIVQGTVFDWFGNAGTLSNYYVTENLFYLFVLILIGIIVRKHVTGTYALLISLIYNLLSYNRSAFMLPVMLLLACPITVTPCQVIGINCFLGTHYKELYTLDLVCYDVLSPTAYWRRIKEQEESSEARYRIFLNF